MKSLKKIFSLLITVSLIIALGMQSVSASSYPSSIKVSSIGKIKYGGTLMKNKKRIALSKNIKVEMMKFFLKTSVPRMKNE
jgi:hypothetical protein